LTKEKLSISNFVLSDLFFSKKIKIEKKILVIDLVTIKIGRRNGHIISHKIDHRIDYKINHIIDHKISHKIGHRISQYALATSKIATDAFDY